MTNCPARSVANSEFHPTGDEGNDVARRITAGLEGAVIRALNPPMGFPMEADRWMTERIWTVALEPVAVAAGVGYMGIHRNAIHLRFGNFILLGTILVGAEMSAYAQELNYNLCLECKLMERTYVRCCGNLSASPLRRERNQYDVVFA